MELIVKQSKIDNEVGRPTYYQFYIKYTNPDRLVYLFSCGEVEYETIYNYFAYLIQYSSNT